MILPTYSDAIRRQHLCLGIAICHRLHFDLLYKVADMGYDIIEVAVEDKDLIDWPRLKKLAS